MQAAQILAINVERLRHSSMQGRCWQAVNPLNLGWLSCVGLIGRMSKTLCPGIKMCKLVGIHTWLDPAECLLEVLMRNIPHMLLGRFLNTISKLPAKITPGASNIMICMQLKTASKLLLCHLLSDRGERMFTIDGELRQEGCRTGAMNNSLN